MRIVSLLPSATEILFAIGAGDEVVGVTHECDYPEPARRLPRVTASVFDHTGQATAVIDRHIRTAVHEGSAIYALDQELLAELRPDLIVTQELCAVCAVAYDQVATAARCLPTQVPVISLEPSTLEDILANIVQVGASTGHAGEANEVVEKLRRRIEAVTDGAEGQERPRVACLEWTDPLMPGGHWVPEMVRRAGGRDVLWEERLPSTYIEWEKVRDADPEVMVLMPCGFGLERTLELAPEVTGRQGFAQLTCSRTGQVFAVDGSSYFNRPGPRIVDGLEMLAQLIHGSPDGQLPPGSAQVSLAPARPPSASGTAPSASRT